MHSIDHDEAIRRLAQIAAYTGIKTEPQTQTDADIHSMATKGRWAPPLRETGHG